MGEKNRVKLYELEFGLKAICWNCGEIFVKENPCDKCEFFVCPHCGICGCQLSESSRKVARSIVLTMKLNGLLPVRSKRRGDSARPT